MKAAVVRAFGLFASVLLAGAAAAQSTQAVEWKVSEGGNGHWYKFVPDQVITWTSARTSAELVGGYLSTVTSQQEQAFLFAVVSGSPQAWNGPYGPFLGATRRGLPTWQWVTGESWGFQAWGPGEPNNDSGGSGPEDRLTFTNTPPIGGWNDVTDTACAGGSCQGRTSSGYVIEWSADCNNDGIVDYGQIQNGQLADDNANGVPDICELSVTGVVPPSVPSQGGSAITIKGNNFPENPVVLVGGLPASDVVRVSATRITAATPSLLPGMASVKVNDFTLEEALYIRPQCGSDLDQDGEVTAADIAIVLLDFGPCYVTATSPQPDDSKPFMLQDQPAPEAPQSR